MGTNELLSVSQVAAELEVTEQHVRHMVRTGHLEPAHRSSTGMFFDPSEVEAVLLIRSSPPALIGSMAARALATCRSLKRRLDEMTTVLGIGNDSLPMDADSVHALHARAIEALNAEAFIDHHALTEWASIINVIDEEYIERADAVENNTVTLATFYKLASKLLKATLADKTTPMLRARAFMIYARNNLKAMAYMGHLSGRGEPAASVDSEIISLAS